MSTATLRDSLDTVFTDGDWFLDIAFTIGDESTPEDVTTYDHYLTLKRRKVDPLAPPVEPILLSTEDETLSVTAPNLVGPRVRAPQLQTWEEGVYDFEQSWTRPDGVTEVVFVGTLRVQTGLSVGGAFTSLPLPSTGPSYTVVRSPLQARVVRGTRGAAGWNGWTPVMATDDETDPPRRLVKVIDWAGEGGPKPTTGAWLGAGGFVTDPDDAADFAGAATADAIAATAAAVAQTALAATATGAANAAAALANEKAGLAVAATTDSIAKTALAVTATAAANTAADNANAKAALAQGVVNSAGTIVTSAQNSANDAAASAASAAAVVTGGTASLVSAAGKIPLADGLGKIDRNWLDNDTLTRLSMLDVQVNHIGVPGRIGFGVGVCPTLTAGFSPLAGTFAIGSDEYGNYKYSDGSIMVWVPAFYERYGHVDNPTYGAYGVNSVDIKPLSAFPNQAAAIAAGYNLHRAFIDGGEICPGFMVDKYQCSNNSGKASSIKLGAPLSSNAAHNPFNALTGAPSNTYGGAFAAAKTRGAQFFPASRFIFAALALLSLAHGQAATSAAACAWYDAAGVINFPKGNNNNALNDQNDNTVTFTSDGYTTGGANSALTGSASNFAKTAHNGQNCGVVDLNGNMWEITPGLTCVATSKTITGATQANPVALTIAAHGLTTGAVALVAGVGGMTQLNDRIFTVTVVDANTVTLDGVNGTAFGAFTTGGSLTTGQFHVAKDSTRMKDFTGGNTLATDHFGATGVAAMMQPIALNLRTDYPNNAAGLRFGNTASQALDPAADGDDWRRRGLGVPKAGGISSAGTNLFGQDYFYQYIRNELCPFSGGSWSSSSNAGLWTLFLSSARTDSVASVGLRAASYPVRPSGNEG
ncbi:hypothetical protein [uncultured Caulobacter sp.]|uniref:hypothetical protein n=1 Tax=uncultured Caulobacter sp. TaxID=158749 RepID=UPI00260ADCCC|nr:hypothetical protein [uncultured Caulobacter sp.]